MLWYGYNHLPNVKKIYKRRTYNCNLAIRTLAFSVLRHGTISRQFIQVYIPSDWELIFLSSKRLSRTNILLYLFNDYYYFKIALIKTYLLWVYEPHSHTLVAHNSITPCFYKMYINRILSLFASFSKLFFLKLKFKGKGYYIYKTYRNTITHQFGHSHRVYIYAHFVTVKFLNKTTVFLFGSSKTDLFTVGYRVQASKYINIFTGRGVRFSKQVLYKKTGKVSSYR